MITFNLHETGTILAALRFYQNALENHQIPTRIETIATDHGSFAALSGREIDELCKKINQ